MVMAIRMLYNVYTISHLALVILFFKTGDIYLVIIVALLDYKKHAFYMKDKDSIP